MKRFCQISRQSGSDLFWRATLRRGRSLRVNTGHDGAWPSKLSKSGRRQSQAGFNLIEVSLAVAICAIGLIALVGLLPTGLDASRRAADDSLITSIASDLLHWRRITPYGYPMYWYPPIGSNSLATASRPITGVTVLDAMGNPQNFQVAGGSTVPNTYYTGGYFLLTETIMNNPVTTDTNTARIVLTIQWPLRGNGSTAANLYPNYSTRTFITDVTRMQ